MGFFGNQYNLINFFLFLILAYVMSGGDHK